MAVRRSFVAMAALLAAAPGAADTPDRVISLNLCTDQLLVLLADREQIAALSFLAADEELSFVADRIDGLPLIDGGMEAAFELAPDLAFAGEFGAQAAVALLEAQGVPVVRLSIASDFETIAEQTALVGAMLGQDDRAQAMIAAMQRALADSGEPSGPRPTALFYQASGYTTGAGTLADAVLEAAGFRNLGAEAGIAGGGFLPLEQLVLRPPDILVAERNLPEHPSLADALLAHPALDAAAAAFQVVELPPALLACGGPFTAEAVTLLRAAREALS